MQTDMADVMPGLMQCGPDGVGRCALDWLDVTSSVSSRSVLKG